MSTINFIPGTVVPSTWLNDVDAVVYEAQSGLTIPNSVNRTQLSKNRDVISVMDFGAVGDGVTDDTAAFNRATQSTVAWNANLQYDIMAPSGPGIRYKINGTVYIRKGQTIRGTGHGTLFDLSSNTTTNSFVLGKGFIAGVATDDAGGAPVTIENLYTLGGAPTKGAIYTNAQGFEISSVFLTSPGIGIEIGAGAGDGIISNCQIDQALTGASFVSCQNIMITNSNLYLAGIGYVFNSSCFDIQINGGIIEYSSIASVLFGDGVSNIKGVIFSGTRFVMNAQNAGTFQGFVQSRANNVDAQFIGCSFRNMYKWAINHQTNGPVNLMFSGCVFDGSPTNAAGYTASTTALGIQTGLQGNYSFTGCEFRNLFGEIATVNTNLSRLNIEGGSVTSCDVNAASQLRFNILATDVPPITVKGVKGFPYTFISGSNWACALPWWGASTAYKVAVKGDTQNAADSRYSAAEEGVYTITWQNAGGTKSIFADKILLWKTPTRTNPGDLAAVVCLGGTPGGAVSTTVFASTGQMCISVPFTNQSGFDFYAETVL